MQQTSFGNEPIKQQKENNDTRLLNKMLRKMRIVTPVRVILVGYLFIILAGALLLSLPIASRAAGSVPFSDALFTATSATCVTGLVRYDTYTCWTLFGQIVILLLIQIGGVGFMTIAISAIVAARKKVGLGSRILMQNSISAPTVGGMVRTTGFIVKGTAIVEGIGAILLSFYFVPILGPGRGIWYSVFHSISAFCNAGFDLFGRMSPSSSLTTIKENWYVHIVLMALIVLGGLGFLVWRDLLEKKFHFLKLRLQSKIVIVTSLVLIFGGAFVIFLCESGSGEFASLPLNTQVLTSLFQSVTARTAGFNSLDLSKMTQSGILMMIFLMMVGGSPGSTAGGMKTTTIAVQFLSVHSVFRRRNAIEVSHRTIDNSVARASACIATMYITLAVGTAMVIAKLESIPMLTALFETCSAVATVGCTLGITSGVGMVSKVILILLMIFGRAGSVTVLMAFAGQAKNVNTRYPVEEVTVG